MYTEKQNITDVCISFLLLLFFVARKSLSFLCGVCVPEKNKCIMYNMIEIGRDPGCACLVNDQLLDTPVLIGTIR